MATIKLLNKGREIVTSRLKGLGTEPKKIGWGTGAGTTAEADTSLFTEASEARADGVSSRQTTTTTNDTYRVVGTIVCVGDAKVITNAALFDEAGNIYIKTDFAGESIEPGESIQFTFNHVFA